MLELHEKYIVDGRGKKTAIVLPYAEWKKILDALEEYQEICAYDKVKARASDPIPFKKALKKLKELNS
jgi:PHD/YefM family antitoxin component YafN of YafNO toxin-antitoxin module